MNDGEFLDCTVHFFTDGSQTSAYTTLMANNRALAAALGKCFYFILWLILSFMYPFLPLPLNCNINLFVVVVVVVVVLHNLGYLPSFHK